MELFIQQYLLLSRQCPIPGLGTFKLLIQPSTHLVAEHRFQSPQWNISFESECNDNDSLAKFVSKANQISYKNALGMIQDWVSQFISNPQSKNIYIPGIGKLKKESGNSYSFTQDHLAISLPDINARKIVRTDAVHQVLVGDTEHSSVYMAEQIQKPKAVIHVSLFWLWALLIALVSICAISFYAFQQKTNEGFWGNQHAIPNGTSSPNYQSIP